MIVFDLWRSPNLGLSIRERLELWREDCAWAEYSDSDDEDEPLLLDIEGEIVGWSAESVDGSVVIDTG